LLVLNQLVFGVNLRLDFFLLVHHGLEVFVHFVQSTLGVGQLSLHLFL
jgi:hypothetical protein